LRGNGFETVVVADPPYDVAEGFLSPCGVIGVKVLIACL
jgi:hypothetical protein